MAKEKDDFDLISHVSTIIRNTPDDFSQIKAALRQANETLYTAYKQGTEVACLLEARSNLIDYLLAYFWNDLLLGESKAGEDVATLVAVGGYGRKEMHPASDIDLLILLPSSPSKQCEERLVQFITLLWDIGLDIGHSVRSVDECVVEAKADLTVITNLIESRFLCGNKQTYQTLQAAISPDKLWDSEAFLLAKLEEQEQRYDKYGQTAYRVEPNLKEGPGGLRDIQVIMWVMQRYCGVLSLDELKVRDLLAEDEYSELKVSRNFIWEIRFVLHNLSKRKEDRLLFQHQRQLAKAFGYEDTEANKAVEEFMMLYYRTITNLDRLTTLLLNLLKEKILDSYNKTQVHVIDEYYEERNGLIAIRDSQLFEKQPHTLLEIFLILQITPKTTGLTPNTVRSIRQNLSRIDNDFRESNDSKSIFIEIMRQQKGVTLALKKMNQYGVLAAYLPAFQGIVGRMQFDLYHAYTVDSHTIQVIRNVRRYSTSKGAEELPFCSDIFKALRKPELLYLAALFHDIAKGRGGDHAKLGAVDAYDFCLSHHLSKQDASTVSWLVERHLYFSIIVQKKDISDPEIIQEFADMVGSVHRLDYLYLLTIADIRGTNLKLWTSWKHSLLQQFYQSARHVLQDRTMGPKESERIEIQKKRDEVLQCLVAEGYSESTCETVWKNFTPRYFLRYNFNTICWHTRCILPDVSAPLVELRQSDKNSTALFIYQKNDPRLFVRIVASLEQLNLNTVEANITSSENGFELYTLHVLNAEGEAITRVDDQENLIERITHNLQEDYIPDTSTQRIATELKHLDVPTKIQFAQNKQRAWTILEIETGDRPGLLSMLGKILYQQGLQIYDARIATLEEQVQDVFQITDLDNKPIVDEQKLDEIKQALESVL